MTDAEVRLFLDETKALIRRIVGERDEARAEVDRLREEARRALALLETGTVVDVGTDEALAILRAVVNWH